jgi:hypothetical protein
MKMTAIKILMLGVGLGLVVLVLGALTVPDSVGEEDEMTVAAVNEETKIEIPPVDAAAPEKTATATFALG